MQDKKWEVANCWDYNLLKENAKENRDNPTEAESVFWSLAKSSGLGQKCRRQYIIGQYIVDFFFRESLLIVELDGEYHFTKEQQNEDIIRQQWLAQKGYTILRFTNQQVLFDTDKTIETIKQHLR
jgi:very-short-patch-repair endonuclease